jgi:hypothetical protein
MTPDLLQPQKDMRIFEQAAQKPCSACIPPMEIGPNPTGEKFGTTRSSGSCDTHPACTAPVEKRD